MGEVRTFSSEDLAAMQALAESRNRTAEEIDAIEGRSVGPKYRVDGNRVAAHAEGFKGEWAVADSLRIPRSADISGRADNGVDLVSPSGHGLDVKYTVHITGRLMCPTSHPMTAHIAVFVTGWHQSDQVHIVGGIGIEDFYRTCDTRFWQCETHFVEQDGLVPWSDLHPFLMGQT